MNRSTVEKQIEGVIGDLDGMPAGSVHEPLIVELRALTELLAHYPKEEDVKGNGSTMPFGAPDRYCCGVHTVCGYDSSTGKCRY